MGNQTTITIQSLEYLNFIYSQMLNKKTTTKK